MSLFTKIELREFDGLTRLLSSKSQMERIRARLEINRLVAEHGREKYNAMFAELQKRDRKKEARR